MRRVAACGKCDGELQVVKTMVAANRAAQHEENDKSTGKGGKCRGNRKELKTELRRLAEIKFTASPFLHDPTENARPPREKYAK